MGAAISGEAIALVSSFQIETVSLETRLILQTLINVQVTIFTPETRVRAIATIISYQIGAITAVAAIEFALVDFLFTFLTRVSGWTRAGVGLEVERRQLILFN